MKVPGRKALAKQIDAEVSELQGTITKYLTESKYHCSFGIDIWTTKGTHRDYSSLSL